MSKKWSGRDRVKEEADEESEESGESGKNREREEERSEREQRGERSAGSPNLLEGHSDSHRTPESSGQNLLSDISQSAQNKKRKFTYIHIRFYTPPIYLFFSSSLS